MGAPSFYYSMVFQEWYGQRFFFSAAQVQHLTAVKLYFGTDGRMKDLESLSGFHSSLSQAWFIEAGILASLIECFSFVLSTLKFNFVCPSVGPPCLSYAHQNSLSVRFQLAADTARYAHGACVAVAPSARLCVFKIEPLFSASNPPALTHAVTAGRVRALLMSWVAEYIDL